MKKIIKEALGVPEHIIETAELIESQIIEAIDDDLTIEELDDLNFELTGDYKIGDSKFNKVDVTFQIYVMDEDTKFHGIDIISTSTKGGKRTLTPDNKLSIQPDENEFDITIDFAVPSTDIKGIDIKNYLKSKKFEIIRTIAHELKHRYDFEKNPIHQMKKMTPYYAASSMSVADIKPINKFLHYLYFIHSIEGLVRPTEIAAAIKSGEVSKKGFLNFLTNDKTYKMLKEIENFTYEKFREDLKKYISTIKELFELSDIEYKGLSDDEIVDTFLNLIVSNFHHREIQIANKILFEDNIMEMLLGLSGKKNKFLNDYIDRLSKFKGNFKKFFDIEEKNFKFVSKQMMKKMAKLYDKAKDLKTESIHNWDLYHKVKKTNLKIIKELKDFTKNM